MKSFNVQVTRLLREWERLMLDDDGVLHCKRAVRTQLILPEKYKDTVLKALHDEMGHQGVERTTLFVRDRFFWPQMQKEMEHYVVFVSCLKGKKPSRETRAPLISIVTTQTFELVSVDFLHADKCSGEYEYILVIIDHFTRFAIYNCTRSEVTGFPPFTLLFGRGPQLPTDLLFRLTPETGTLDHQQYMKN